jgi:hypothetical protein
LARPRARAKLEKSESGIATSGRGLRRITPYYVPP